MLFRGLVTNVVRRKIAFAPLAVGGLMTACHREGEQCKGGQHSVEKGRAEALRLLEVGRAAS